MFQGCCAPRSRLAELIALIICSSRQTEQINLCQIDHFVATPAQDCLESEKSESFHLRESYRWRHGELLPMDEYLDQSRSVMLKSLSKHRANVFGSLRPESHHPGGLGQLRKIRILQIGSKIDEAGRFHFQFDKGENIISEDDDFDG